MGTQGIQVGDAVLKFLADTTDVDRGFASLGPKAKAAMGPANDALEEVQENLNETGKDAQDAGDEIEDAGKRGGKSLRDARGEAALLGEEFGLRIPRHVRNFLTELPGVGEALTAAFSATAVLFLIQALVEGSEKLSEWIAKTFIFTQIMRDSNDQITFSNKVMGDLAKIQEEATAKWDALTGKTKDDTKAMKDQAQQALLTAEANVESVRAKVNAESIWQKFLNGLGRGGFNAAARKEANDALIQEAVDTAKIAAAKVKQIDEQADKDRAEEIRQNGVKDQIIQLENDKKIAMVSAQTEQEKYNLTQFFEERKLALLQSLGNKEKAEIASLQADIVAQQQEHALKIQSINERIFQDLSVALHFLSSEETVFAGANRVLTGSLKETDQQLMGPHLTAIKQLDEVTKELGITTKDDLVANLNKAQQALIDFVQAGKQDVVELNAIFAAIQKNQEALKNYGKATDDLKVKSHGFFAQMEADSKTGGQALQQWKQLSVNAADSIASSLQGALMNLILAQGSFGKALEEATKKVLASIASQAAVTGLFDLGKAYAAAAAFDYAGAAQYEQAAGTMFAVAALAAGASMAIPGGGGTSSSGSNPSQLQNNSSNTSGSGSRGAVTVTGVQGHATGALIMHPVLSTFAENGPEAAIPLNDPRAMEHIGNALAGALARQGGGGGTTHHWHIEGMISPDNLNKVIGQINKRVARGQSTLVSSNTFRVTKRSA